MSTLSPAVYLLDGWLSAPCLHCPDPWPSITSLTTCLKPLMKWHCPSWSGTAPHEVALPLMKWHCPAWDSPDTYLAASYVLLPFAHTHTIPHKLIFILNQAGLDQSLLLSCLQRNYSTPLFQRCSKLTALKPPPAHTRFCTVCFNISFSNDCGIKHIFVFMYGHLE